MNRTGLFIALALALVIGLAVRDLSRTRSETRRAVLRRGDKIISAETQHAGRVRARRRDVDRVGLRAAGDCCAGRQAGAAGSAAADVGAVTVVFLLVTHAAFRRHPHQSHLQELLGPAAPGGGDAVQRPAGIRAVVGSARRAAARNCSFFSGEGATAFWTYAPAALTPPAWRPLAYAAATLFGVVDQRAADGVRRTFLHRRRDRGAGHVPGDLAGLCLDLPLVVDPADRRADRCRADAAGLAGLPAPPAPASAAK